MKKIILLFFSSILLFGAPLATDENLKVGKLDNGFTYYIYKNATPKQSGEFYLYINAGSINEKQSEQGYAHFVEHMAFNGSEDFSKNELITMLEGLGVVFGADLNAATGFDKTFYKLTIKTDQDSLKKAFKVFENMASKVLFTNEDIEVEKGVIVEEDRLGNDEEKRIFEQEIPYIYGDSMYTKRLPIGKMDIVKSANSNKLKEFYRRNYYAKNMSFVAVGDFDTKQIENLIKSSFSNIKNNTKTDEPDRTIPFLNKFTVFNASDKELDSNSIRVFYEVHPNGGINSYKKFKDEIILKYIERLVRLLDDKRVDSGESILKTSFDTINLHNQKSLSGFFGDVIGDDFNKSLSDLFSVINGIKKFGFNQSDFDTVKENLVKENATFITSKSTRTSSFYVNELLKLLDLNSTFLSNDTRYELTKQALNEIKIDDVNAEFNKITDTKGVIVEILSQKKQNLNENDVKKLMQAAPYNTKDVKKLPKTLLDDSNLTKQRPVKSTFNEKDKIHTYEFANGAVVIFKELDTRKDVVLFSAIKKGGITNFSDAKNARFAVEISNGSGIGEFNDYEVSKITAGEQFSLTKFINELSLGFKADSTKKDVENLLKAFYVDFNHPKISKHYADVYSIITKDVLEKNRQNPNFEFMRQFMDFYYDGNKKMKAVSVKDVENMNFAKMQDFLDKNYQNAGEFIFIFVGDIPENELLNLAEKYIANLKGDKNKTIIKDDNVRSVSGVKHFERDFLSENLANVEIFIKNDNVKFTQKNVVTLSAATHILNVLLREKIREQDSNVYGIRANASLNKFPYLNSALHINFSSDPKNVKNIIKSTKNIISYMQKEIVDEKYLENFKKSAQITLQKEYEQPSFWLKKITNSYLNDEELTGFDEQILLINSIDLKDILEAAKSNFNMDNFVVSVLKGKKKS